MKVELAALEQAVWLVHLGTKYIACLGYAEAFLESARCIGASIMSSKVATFKNVMDNSTSTL